MPTTRLAAILFTDIVGYTAMMQTDQAQAMAAVKGYEAVLRERIAHHKGELIQTYGDGSLSIFDSASSAVLCAKEIQERIRETVPLRIGIHLGEVTRDGEHTFGDGVNIASRIESMGIAGAVLVSSSIRQQIKNKPEFDVKSLGKFSFKNVAEPMTVYALANEGFAVPDPQKMVGKGRIQPPNTKSTDGKTLIQSLSIVFVGILMALGIWLSISWKSEGPVEIDKSIVVLPFKNMSNDPEQEYFSDGISEDIRTILAQISDLKVIARASAFSFKGSAKSLTEIADELQIAHILTGVVRRDKDKVRITTQLIHVESGTLIWAAEFNRNIDDILAVQQEVALEISQKLNVQLTEKESQVLTQKRDINPKAYALYIKARYLNFSSNQKNAELGKRLLEEAISIDSTYADAYAALGFEYLSGVASLGELSTSVAKEKSDFFFQKALELDPANGTAYGLMAMGKLFLEWDFEGATAAFEKAKIYKGQWWGLALLYLYTGRLQDAKSDIRTFEQLDPAFGGLPGMMGMVFFYQDSLSKAVNELNTSIALSSLSVDACKYLAKIEVTKNNYTEAIDILESGMEEIGKRTPYLLGDLGVAYFQDGQVEKTEVIIAELKENWNTTKQGSPAFFLALIYANMGDLDTAFEWLEKSYQDHEVEMLWLKMDSLTRPLHGDPRYQDLLERVGFP